ncbi:hypothetical protein, partial [Flavobacterium suncheonense]
TTAKPETLAVSLQKIVKMKTTIILIALIFISCNSKEEPKSECDVTYRMLIKENEKYNSYLIENIKSNIRKNPNNQNIAKFDSLTKDYLNFLLEIETEMAEKTSDVLFKDSKYSSRGKEFINKTKTYKSEIENLVDSENLKKRINLVLNTNDVELPEKGNVIANNNETGEHKNDKIYIYYLDYYYKGFPKNQFLSFLNNKKKSILEIENEFIETSIN